MKAIHEIFKSQKIRFGIVGIINTVTDIGILNFLVVISGLPLVVSNTISTTIAMVFSFFLNKNAVFHNQTQSKRQILLFIAVTVVGLWVVQTAVVLGVYSLLASLPDELRLNIAKAIGIIFSLTWNYVWYSRVVFKQG